LKFDGDEKDNWVTGHGSSSFARALLQHVDELFEEKPRRSTNMEQMHQMFSSIDHQQESVDELFQEKPCRSTDMEQLHQVFSSTDPQEEPNPAEEEVGPNV
jgi:hypothetical protein